MPASNARSALDGMAARVAALAVAVLTAGALAFIHRDDLIAPKAAEIEAAPDPFHGCVAVRSAEIEKMLAEKSIDAQRADIFRARAEAICRAEADKAAGKVPGLPPGLTPTQKF